MKKVKWIMNTGYVGMNRGEIEVEDDASDDEIRAACVEEAWNYLDLWWEVE